MDIKEYKEGQFDQSNRKIVDIYMRTNEYVIYRTDTDIVHVYIADEHLPQNERIHYKNLMNIAIEIGRVNSLQSGRLTRMYSINKAIARALAKCLEGEIESAKEALSDVEGRLIRLRLLEGRLQYQLSSAIIVAFLLCSVVLIIFVSNYDILSGISSYLIYLKVALFGSLGGFLSVSLGINKVDIDLDADWRTNILAGSSRILIALVASLFVYFGIKANLVFGIFNDDPSNFGLYIAAMISGFSETFVPNIITKISKEETDKLKATPQNEKVVTKEEKHPN